MLSVLDTTKSEASTHNKLSSSGRTRRSAKISRTRMLAPSRIISKWSKYNTYCVSSPTLAQTALAGCATAPPEYHCQGAQRPPSQVQELRYVGLRNRLVFRGWNKALFTHTVALIRRRRRAISSGSASLRELSSEFTSG